MMLPTAKQANSKQCAGNVFPGIQLIKATSQKNKKRKQLCYCAAFIKIKRMLYKDLKKRLTIITV